MPVFVNLIATIIKPQILPSSAVRKEDSLNAALGQLDKKVLENHAILLYIEKRFFKHIYALFN